MDISRFLNLKNTKRFALDVFIWSACGSFLLWIGSILEKNLSSSFDFITHSPETIRIATFFLFLILLFISVKEVLKFIRVWFCRNKDYIFTSKDWPNKWVFNGKTELTKEGYLFVKSSRAGCLLKNYYWKDFKMSFDMRFCNKDDKKIQNYQKRVGLVFRAEDLDNYFMIEIGEDVENSMKLSVKPHIRYMGGWEWMSVEEIENTESFDFTNFIKVSLVLKGDTGYLFYNETPVFKWVLPSHVDMNHVESGVRHNQEQKEDDNENMPGKSFAGHVQSIPFRLKHGLVGFRAYMKHGAIIRNLEIKPL